MVLKIGECFTTVVLNLFLPSALFRDFHKAVAHHNVTAKDDELYSEVHRILHSGAYSNLGARGKNFQKLMLSEKKRGLILACIFSPKIKVFSKKKKSPHFDFISDFPIFPPKSGCSLKKKVSAMR